MRWLVLVEGTPDEPDTWDWEEIASFPTPVDFFGALFGSLCGIDTRQGKVTEEIKISREMGIVRGFQGTESIGFRWVEQECLKTSMFPVQVEYDTYGLTGMEIRWRCRREYAGQLGYTAFRHGSLTARFEKEKAFAQFEKIWCRVFGSPPVFQPALAETSGDHTDEVQ